MNYRYLNGDPITLEAIVTPYRLQGMQCVLTDFESAGIGLALPGKRWSWGGWNSKSIIGTTSDQAVPLNATAYLAGVYDGEKLRLFINGKLQSGVKELNGGIKSSGMPFLVGANPAQKGTIREAIHVRIDALRISKGPLYVESYKPPASFITTPETLVLLNLRKAVATSRRINLATATTAESSGPNG